MEVKTVTHETYAEDIQDLKMYGDWKTEIRIPFTDSERLTSLIDRANGQAVREIMGEQGYEFFDCNSIHAPTELSRTEFLAAMDVLKDVFRSYDCYPLLDEDAYYSLCRDEAEEIWTNCSLESEAEGMFRNLIRADLGVGDESEMYWVIEEIHTGNSETFKKMVNEVATRLIGNYSGEGDENKFEEYVNEVYEESMGRVEND